MRLIVYKQTADDFRSNFKLTDRDIELVRVRFCDNISPPDREPCYRASVFGNDDLGFIFDSSDRDCAKQAFDKVISLDDITFNKLKSLGFEQF